MKHPAYLISTQIMFVCNRRTYPCRSSLQIFSCPFDPSGKFLELFRIFSDNVCLALNISKRALQTYRDNGLIPYSNIGGKFFYKEVDIQQILEEGLIKKRK